MQAARTSRWKLALALGASIWLGLASRARAADVHPFTQVGIDGAFDGNITGHGDYGITPWNTIYTRGPADWHGGLVVAGGAEADLTDRLSMLCLVDLAGERYLDYPALSGFVGSAYLQGKAVDLPGDLDAVTTYSYRDDFQGDQGHDATLGIKRPLPFAVVGYADAGYDWSLTSDTSLAHQGPFADLGADRTFRSTGTTLFAGVAGLLQAYQARTDRILSVSGGVSQSVGLGVSVFAQGSFDWVGSTEADRSLTSPEGLVGTSWGFP